MDKERTLYEKFLDKLLDKLDDPLISDKDMNVILNFLKFNNIQATIENPKVKELSEKLSLPFDEEFPERF